MADNYETNPGTGGKIFRSDQIGGIDNPGVKIVLGADGVDDAYVASGNPLPVTGTVTIQDGGGSITIDGTVAVSGTVAISAAALPLPSGAATSAKQPALGTAGTASTDVITVQGIAAMTPVLVTLSGTNNIATVTTVTTVSTVTVVSAVTAITNALPAGTNLLGRASASLETGTIYNATTALTPKFALANVAQSQTDSAVVAAVTAKKIRVLDYKIMAGGTATNVTFTSKPGGAGAAISMLHACGANGGIAPGFSPVGHFETVSGEGLSLTTGAGSTVGVQVTYIEV